MGCGMAALESPESSRRPRSPAADPAGFLRLSHGTRDARQQAGEHQPHRHLRIDAGAAVIQAIPTERAPCVPTSRDRPVSNTRHRYTESRNQDFFNSPITGRTIPDARGGLVNPGRYGLAVEPAPCSQAGTRSACAIESCGSASAFISSSIRSATRCAGSRSCSTVQSAA